MPYKDPERQRQFQRERLAARKAEFYRDKCCVRCGSTESLELDHIDRTQKVSHSVWSWSQVRRDAEIAKCQVLCHNCHWEKTRDDMGWRQVHGTPTSYSKYKCRCDLCREAHAAEAREYRAR